MSIVNTPLDLQILPVYELSERIMPISDSLEITIPSTVNTIDIEKLYDIEVKILVNGIEMLRYRKEIYLGIQTKKWYFNPLKPNQVYCTVSAQETADWRGLVQAYIKLIALDEFSRDFAQTQYLPVNLFIARKGFQPISLDQTPGDLIR